MAVSRLDAAIGGTGATFTAAVSTGVNRALVVKLGWGNNATDVTALDYGGQAMVKIGSIHTGGGRGASIWYLLDAGIAAASSTTLTPTWETADPDAGRVLWTVMSYEGVHQGGGASTVPDSITGTSFSGNPNPATAVDVTEVVGGAAVACSVTNGQSGNPTWGADLTEQTFIGGNNRVLATADRLSTAAGVVSVRLTWINVSQRADVSAVFAPAPTPTGPTAELANGAAFASDATASVTVQAGVAVGGAIAEDAAVSTAVTVTAPAEVAIGAAFAADAVASINPIASDAIGAGLAPFVPGSRVSVLLISESAIEATGTAHDATVVVSNTATALPETAVAVGLAVDAVAVAGGSTAAPAELAVAVGVASDAGVSVSATVAAAAASPAVGQAFPATVAISESATVTPSTAIAGGVAENAAVSTSANATAPAGAAVAVGLALDATVAVTSNATVTPSTAAAVGVAENAAVSTSASVTAPAGVALAVGTAHDAATPAVSPQAAPAVATTTVYAGTAGVGVTAATSGAIGTADDAAVQTDSQVTLQPTTASATGSALPPVASLTVQAGSAIATGGADNAVSSAATVAPAATASAIGQASTVSAAVIAVIPGTATATGQALAVYTVGAAKAYGLPQRLLIHSLIVVRPVRTEDAHGMKVPDYGPDAVRTSITGWLQQDRRSEAYQTGRNPRSQMWLLMTNDLGIQADDRIEWLDHPEGLTIFTVHGPPEPAYSATRSGVHHIEATLEIVEG